MSIWVFFMGALCLLTVGVIVWAALDIFDVPGGLAVICLFLALAVWALNSPSPKKVNHKEVLFYESCLQDGKKVYECDVLWSQVR